MPPEGACVILLLQSQEDHDVNHAESRERPRRRLASLALAVLIASSVGALPRSVAASPDTLRLAIEDLVVGVVDVAASPVSGGIATARNLDAVSDNGFVQSLYVLPGWLGLTCLQATQGVLRVIVGAVQLVPGLVLFPFPGTDVPEDFNVFRRGTPLIDVQNPLADNPDWLPYVLPVTPFTIDLRVAPISAWAIYDSDGQGADAGDEVPGAASAR